MPRNVLTLNGLIQHLTELRDENPKYGELLVKSPYPSHDYWKSELAGDVIGAEIRLVEHSAYHDTDKVIDMDEDREADEKSTEVVLLETRTVW